MPVDAANGAGRLVTILVDGRRVPARRGQSLAAALLGAGLRFSRADRGFAAGVFCNMGTCGECMVTLAPPGRRLRACLVAVEDGMTVELDV